jgi:hypothetical protein
LINSFFHEFGHLLCGNPDHDKRWFARCKDLYPSFLNTFDVGNINVGNIAGNVGNITGVQNLLTDYHLLQSYRKFSQRILATEGQWEIGGDQKIRLYPVPRGAFPVVVQYLPVVSRFKTPEAAEIAKRMLVAECKIMLGNIRSKFSSLPTPDGGSLTMNGNELRTEGNEEKKQCILDAISYGKPLPIILW